MAQGSSKRPGRATPEDRKRHAALRRQIEAELPDIMRRGREKLRDLQRLGVPIRHAVAALKAERERQGLSLADVNQRTGIDRSALSRLENNEDANPTMNTLARYADAVGKRLVVLLADADSPPNTP